MDEERPAPYFRKQSSARIPGRTGARRCDEKRGEAGPSRRERSGEGPDPTSILCLLCGACSSSRCQGGLASSRKALSRTMLQSTDQYRYS